jgi:hypothetical protein
MSCLKPKPLQPSNVEIEWPKQIHKRNIERFKSGKSYTEDTHATPVSERMCFSDDKNTLYAKYDRFLSTSLFETIRRYFDERFKEPSAEIVLYFSNVWIKREYMPIRYRRYCQGFSFLDQSLQTEIVTIYHKDWRIYCYIDNPFDIWSIKAKEWQGLLLINMYKKNKP